MQATDRTEAAAQLGLGEVAGRVALTIELTQLADARQTRAHSDGRRLASLSEIEPKSLAHELAFRAVFLPSKMPSQLAHLQRQ